MSIPTVTITDNLPGTANRATANIAFTLIFSEPVTGLAKDDFTVTNGTVSSVSGSGTTWTVNVTPAQDVASGAIGLTLKAGAVTSQSTGDANALATNSAQAIDTMAPTHPQLLTGFAFTALAAPQVTMVTSMGTIVLELHPQQAPATVGNMLSYADAGYFDGTIFHRVIEGFMVQGGGFTSGLVAKTTDAAIPIESSNGLVNTRGSIAMARTSDPNSATSQFFINQVDNGFLNYSSSASPGYAVFGHVLTGLAVVDGIAGVATTTVGGYSDVPVQDITIISASQTTAGALSSNAHTIQIGGLETGATWAYSLDGGGTWLTGSGSSFSLATGSYIADAIQVRQTDAAGNTTTSTLGMALTITDHVVTAPTVSISDNLTGTANQTTGNVAYTLTFSEAVTGLAADDFIVSHGSVASLSGSGTTWTVNITPEMGVASGTIGLTLRTGAVIDAAGDPNAIITNNSQAIDTLAPVAPKLVPGASFDYQVNPQVSMQTSLGIMAFELYPEQAPNTVANFLAYVDASFYDGTLFHQVYPGFVLQAGSYTTGLAYKTPLYGPIALESNNGLNHVTGSLAMVRGSTADSATSQFFIDLADNTGLNYSSSTAPGYAVFGLIVSGQSVMNNIATVPTASNNVPLTDVTITSLRQSVAGSAISKFNTFQISDLETGATWAYSLDAGQTWQTGSGGSLAIPDGNYAANAIQVRQTDASGNVSASTGKFTSTLVVDTTAPTVTAFDPLNGATGVPLGNDLVITFSESIQRGSGSIELKTADGTTVESFDAASSTRLSISGNTLTIDPSANLAYVPGYTLAFAAGTLTDMAGNALAGSSDYHFTTNHPVQGHVGLEGIPAQGQTLSANTGALTDADGLGTLGYQWLADGDAISTASTLLLGAAEMGKAISVRVSYTDGHGISETLYSAALYLGTIGNDTLTSTSSGDTLAGGTGDDIYAVLDAGNVIVELPGEGHDTVVSPVSWTLGANLEDLVLTGHDNTSATGNALDNVLTGNDGNNILDGGVGADTMAGGAENDTYVVDNVGDVVQEAADAGAWDTVVSRVDHVLSGNVENLALAASVHVRGLFSSRSSSAFGGHHLHVGQGADGTGNDSNNQLIGNQAANRLEGGLGDDLISAGAGDDLLTGGAGNDVLIGGQGRDIFAFDSLTGIDRIADLAAEDRLWFDAMVFTGLAPGALAPSAFAAGAGLTTAQDADERIIHDTMSGALYYDGDGAGGADAVEIAVLLTQAYGAGQGLGHLDYSQILVI